MRILIVGGGIIGLSVAEALLSAGHRVDVYEQGAIPNELASSTDQHRLIRYPYGELTDYARLVAPAYGAWGRLWRRLGRSHYVETGTLALSHRDHGWLESSAEGLAEINQPVTWLGARDLAERFPLLSIGDGDRGFHLPSGGMLLARPLLENLAGRIAARGGALHPNTRVEAVDPAAGALTLAGGRRVAGDLVVVAAGPWLPDLLPDLAGQVTPSRQAYAYLEPPAETLAAWARHPIVLDIGAGSGFYLVPPASGTVMKVGDHGFSLAGHPDREREGRPADVEESLAKAGERIAGFERYRVGHIGTCFYTVAPDERFIAELRGAACILTGFSGHGFKFAPLIGEQLADVLTGRLAADDFARWISGRWISGQAGAMEEPAPPA